MRLVMMGTGSFAEPTLEALLGGTHQVVGLVTQPDRITGKERGSTRQARRGMKEMAQERGIPTLQPESINTPEGIRDLQAWQPDLLVVAAYGQILSRDVLAAASNGGINVHASLLPKYRGRRADRLGHLSWRTTDRCNHYSHVHSPGRRRPLAQEATAIGPEETAGEVEERLAVVGARLAASVVDQIAAGRSRGTPQDKAQATKVPKLTKEHGLIDWSRHAQGVCNQIRAMQPWPTAYTFVHSPKAPPVRLLVFRAKVVPDPTLALEGPGPAWCVSSRANRTSASKPGPATRWKSWSFSPRASAAWPRRISCAVTLSLMAGNWAGQRHDCSRRNERPRPRLAGPSRMSTENRFCSGHFGPALCASSLAAADRRLATQLAYGVLRRRGTLDALLRPRIKRQPHQVEPWIRETLRLGVFQLLLLSHIPPHAALYETVGLADFMGAPRAKGFINAVLRSVARLITVDQTSACGPDALPVADNVYRKLGQTVLPDPAAFPVEYLTQAFSLPGWLAARWLDRHGWDECLRLGFWFAGPASLTLRVNTLRCDRATLLPSLGDKAWPGTHPQAVICGTHMAVPEIPGFAEGHFVVQDESAMQVATAVAPEPGQRVLDLCARPGRQGHAPGRAHGQSGSCARL